MRWSVPALLCSLLLSACPPEPCARGCAARVAQCGDADEGEDQCQARCAREGTWGTSYVDCLEAAASCTQIGLCPAP